MTTAREQAQQAAQEATWKDNDPEVAADAASDVWEPLLRDLADGIMEEVASGYLIRPRHETWDALTRAKEALE